MLCRSYLLNKRASRLVRILPSAAVQGVQDRVGLSRRPSVVFVNEGNSNKICNNPQNFQENYIGRGNSNLNCKREKNNMRRGLWIPSHLWEGSRIRKPPSCKYRLFIMEKEELPRAIHRFHAIPIKMPIACFAL